MGVYNWRWDLLRPRHRTLRRLHGYGVVVWFLASTLAVFGLVLPGCEEHVGYSRRFSQFPGIEFVIFYKGTGLGLYSSPTGNSSEFECVIDDFLVCVIPDVNWHYSESATIDLIEFIAQKYGSAANISLDLGRQCDVTADVLRKIAKLDNVTCLDARNAVLSKETVPVMLSMKGLKYLKVDDRYEHEHDALEMLVEGARAKGIRVVGNNGFR